MAAIVANLSLVVGFCHCEQKPRDEHKQSSDTSSVEPNRRPKQRTKWLPCTLLGFLDSTSAFFVATRPVWFTWQCRVVVNDFWVSRIFPSRNGGFWTDFLVDCNVDIGTR